MRRVAAKRLRDVEQVFTALAHPARRQILLTVHFWGGSMRAGDVAARFGHSWPTTTRHLRVLEDAGLLSHARIGRTRTYRLNKRRLDIARQWLGWFDRDVEAERTRERASKSAAG